MARPKKAKTLDKRLSIRVSDETYAAYEQIAAAFDVPVGQLLRQVLTLEVGELRIVVDALQRHARGNPFATLPHSIDLTQRGIPTPMTSGGFTARLRQEAIVQLGRVRPRRVP